MTITTVRLATWKQRFVAFSLLLFYLPNGNPQPGPKFTHKLAWFERLIVHANDLITTGIPVVLAGDYNLVPSPQDIYPTTIVR